MQKLMLKYRFWLIVVIHIFIFSACYICSYFIRVIDLIMTYGASIVEWPIIVRTLPWALVIKLLVSHAFRQYSGWWRYVGLQDVVRIAVSVFLGDIIVLGLRLSLPTEFNIPIGAVLIDMMLATAVLCTLRASIRIVRERTSVAKTGETAKRVLLIGAGDASEALIREITTNPALGIEVVGILDDDRLKHGSDIRGVRILGPVEDAPKVIANADVSQVLIARPEATGREMRHILEILKPTGVPSKTLPAMTQLLDGKVSLGQIRDVDITDLLGREPVTIDTQQVGENLRGRVIMVTGAGGSIGSELCRQLRRFHPLRLILVERYENNLFQIDSELTGGKAVPDVVPAICDLSDRPRLRHLFEMHKPEVIFHAAAHKHVPMMEINPCEAAKNNVRGTKCLADLAAEFKVAEMVMISTDKAINPTSVMGATKRVAEMYCQALGKMASTHFVTVRFGNVLGSSGSVIPVFQDQIRRGGPVTVTHPEMRRYFMLISEAVQLVLQAAALGRGGEIFVLDMGEPIKIVDMARDLIRLSGFEPDMDIRIEFTGLRPGEKLFEELRLSGEGLQPTRHPKIVISKCREIEFEKINADTARLVAAGESDDSREVAKLLGEIVPEYAGKENGVAKGLPQ